MADPRKVKVLDSYQTLKAVRGAGADDRVQSAAAELAPPKPPLAGAPRTVIPSKQVILCHECGYSFQLHGRARTVPCSKCRAVLDLTDHVISENWSQSLKTAAAIHIQLGAVVLAGELVGRHVMLDGKLAGGRVRALERLTLGPHAEFSEDSVSAPDWEIGAGAVFTWRQRLACRALDIGGSLRARVQATGLVTIHAGGLLDGELTAAHLAVEEGGSLCALLTLTPA